jgi:type II secretory pathway component PulM
MKKKKVTLVETLIWHPNVRVLQKTQKYFQMIQQQNTAIQPKNQLSSK